jgi:hypothetical protein
MQLTVMKQLKPRMNTDEHGSKAYNQTKKRSEASYRLVSLDQAHKGGPLR